MCSLDEFQRHGMTTDEFCLRLLTPLGMSYAAAKKRAEPYAKSWKSYHRCGETVQVVPQAVGADRRAYVLINNRAEGNAPLTVQGLVDILHGDGWRVDFATYVE
jgi:hypothetical protein